MASDKREYQALTYLLLLKLTFAQQHQLNVDLQRGILKRPLDADPTKFVLFDFRPAFPPYTKESLKELLLLNDHEEESDDSDGELLDYDNVTINDGATDVQSAETMEVITTDGDSALESSLENRGREDKELDDNTPLGTDDSSKDQDDNLSGEWNETADVNKDESEAAAAAAAKNPEEEDDMDVALNVPDATEISSQEDVTEKVEPDAVESAGEAPNEEPIAESNEPKVEARLSEEQDAIVSADYKEEEKVITAVESVENGVAPNEYSVPDSETTDAKSAPDDIASDEDMVQDSKSEDSDAPEAEVNHNFDEENVYGQPAADNDDTQMDVSDVFHDQDGETASGNEGASAESDPVTEVKQNVQLTDAEIIEQVDSSGKMEDESKEESPDRITISYEELPPVSSNLNTDQDANREFVTGLDEIDKFFESVLPPDELDVGADGSSMQDVLVGQGLKIIFKRARSFGSSVKERFEKIVEKALPQQLINLAGQFEEEEEESLEDIFKMMNGDVPLDTKSKTESTANANARPPGQEDDKLENRFPLLKKPKVNKIYKYARRKWRQAKHILDDFLSMFGNGGGDDLDFSGDLGDLNFENVRSLVERNRINIKDGNREVLRFNSEVDDSFIRSRYDAMMTVQKETK